MLLAAHHHIKHCLLYDRSFFEALIHLSRRERERACVLGESVCVFVKERERERGCAHTHTQTMVARASVPYSNSPPRCAKTLRTMTLSVTTFSKTMNKHNGKVLIC